MVTSLSLQLSMIIIHLGNVGAQSDLKVDKTIWVAKPIVTNFLGPNVVGDHRAQT